MTEDVSTMREDESRVYELVVLSIVLCALATLAVIARSIIRCFVLRNFWWDDFTIVAAVIFTLGYLIEILVLKSNGLGMVQSELTAENMVNFLKVTVVVEIIYYVAVALIKTSILLLYLRFAVSETLRRLCYGTIVFGTVFSIVCVFVVLVQCIPLTKTWDIKQTVRGTCINTTALFYTTSGLNIITDIWIIGLPVKALRGMNRPKRELIALFIIFGVGILALIVSIVRLHSIFTYTLSTDPFHDAIPVNMWSMIELNVAILCASVPSLKLLISPLRLRQAMHDKRHKYRPQSLKDRYFSDQEHISFVKERMATLPANLIDVETVCLSEASAVMTADSVFPQHRSRSPSNQLPGGDCSHDEDENEEKLRQSGIGFLRHPGAQNSVESFCYVGKPPEPKNELALSMTAQS